MANISENLEAGEDVSKNVYIHPDHTDIIVWQSPVFPSLELFETMGKELQQIGESVGNYIIVTDSSKTKSEIPSDARSYLRDLIKALPGLKYVAFSTGRRKFMNIIIKFIMGKSNYSFKYSVHSTFEGALQKAIAEKSKINS